MEECRGVVVMGRPRDPKTFHKNRKLNLLFILIFERQVCQKREKAVPRFLTTLGLFERNTPSTSRYKHGEQCYIWRDKTRAAYKSV